MANPIKGQVAFKTKAGPRKAALTFNTIIELEDATGKDVQTLLQEVNAASLRATRGFLWAGLLAFEPDLTLQEAGDVADELGPRLGEVMRDLFARCGFLGGDAAPEKPQGAVETLLPEPE